MLKYFLLIVFTVFLLGMHASAYAAGRLHGKVFHEECITTEDGECKERYKVPLEGIKLQFFRTNNLKQAIATAKTRNDGRFKVLLKRGKYIAVVLPFEGIHAVDWEIINGEVRIRNNRTVTKQFSALPIPY